MDQEHGLDDIKDAAPIEDEIYNFGRESSSL